MPVACRLTSAWVTLSSVSLFLEEMGSIIKGLPVGSLSKLPHETSLSHHNPDYRTASTLTSPAPHCSSAETLFGGWWWMRVETAICFRGCCQFLWVVPPVLGPKADKSELLVILENIGLLQKAQDPVGGVLHETQCWGVFRMHPLAWALQETLVPGCLAWGTAWLWAWSRYWELSMCEMVVSLGCTEAQECWGPIVRYHVSLGNIRLGCKCLKQLEHPPSFFFLTRHLYPLLDLAVVILTADPMFCFHPHWGSTFSVLPLSIPLQPLSITITFSLRGVLLFEIFVKV